MGRNGWMDGRYLWKLGWIGSGLYVARTAPVVLVVLYKHENGEYDTKRDLPYLHSDME